VAGNWEGFKEEEWPSFFHKQWRGGKTFSGGTEIGRGEKESGKLIGKRKVFVLIVWEGRRIPETSLERRLRNMGGKWHTLKRGRAQRTGLFPVGLQEEENVTYPYGKSGAREKLWDEIRKRGRKTRPLFPVAGRAGK